MAAPGNAELSKLLRILFTELFAAENGHHLRAETPTGTGEIQRTGLLTGDWLAGEAIFTNLVLFPIPGKKITGSCS
jgi:hypothetical protein